MTGIFLYMLICSGATSCPKEPIYSSDVMFSESACREKAPKIAIAMHYKQGGDWAWKCFEADYKPVEVK
jgi:hypothetical protein